MSESWEKMLAKYPEANFLQSEVWAKMNEKIGHKVILKEFEPSGIALMIVKNAKRGRYLEIPGGPLLDWKDKKAVKNAFETIKQIAKAEKCAFVRLRPQLFKTPENMKILAGVGAKVAPMHLHAEHTVMIDLSKSEDDLLADMRRQTRYEVRRSAKLGIIVESSNSKEIFEEFQKVQASLGRCLLTGDREIHVKKRD